MKTRIRNLGFLMLIILSLTFFSTISVIAQDNGERELEIGVYDDYVEIMSYFENETLATEFEIRSDTQGGEGHLAIEMEYRIEQISGENSTEFEFEMEVVYHDLIEFVDENEDGKYDIDDTIIKTIPLGDQGVVYYDSPTSTISSINGVNGYEFVLKGNIDGVDLVITAVIYESDVSVDGVDLEPTQVKIEIEIANFTFDSTDSLLALKTEVRTTTSLEIEIKGEDNVEIESEIATGGYSSSNVATVNGIIQDVGISTLNEGGEIFMYSAYPQGDIVHDPILGVTTKTPSDDPNGIPGFSMVLLGLISIVSISLIVISIKRPRIR